MLTASAVAATVVHEPPAGDLLDLCRRKIDSLHDSVEHDEIVAETVHVGKLTRAHRGFLGEEQ